MTEQQIRNKIARLKVSLKKANDKETQRFSRIPWGAGIRWSKISVSYSKSDELRNRIEELEKLLPNQ